MPPKASPDGGQSSSGFENLTEEEITFGWRSLAQQGQITVPKIRQFMQDVCNVKLSIVQAKDLLNYMDANGDGRVGQEDFKFFMQTGRLSQTDSTTFMWKPKAKFREEHGEVPESHDDIVPSKANKAKGYDAKTLDRIKASLDKYEQETWEKLLKEEEAFLHSLFEQFDRSGKGEELDTHDYHKMLARWFPLASWCSSGKFRAPDTLAVINYLKEKEKAKKKKEEEPPAEEKKSEEEDKTIPYQLWLDVVNGKYRPENPK